MPLLPEVYKKSKVFSLESANRFGLVGRVWPVVEEGSDILGRAKHKAYSHSECRKTVLLSQNHVPTPFHVLNSACKIVFLIV